MKIMYVHGLGSSGNSRTAKLLREKFVDHTIYSPDIPNDPLEAMAFLEKYYEENKPDIVVGTSLGAFYTMMIKGPKKILVNPAFDADNDVYKAIGYGTYDYLNDRQDGITTYVVDEKMVSELKVIKENFFKNVIDKTYIQSTYAFFGKQDPLFSHYQDFINIYGEDKASFLLFEHRINEKIFDTFIAPKIEEYIYQRSNARLSNIPAFHLYGNFRTGKTTRILFVLNRLLQNDAKAIIYNDDSYRYINLQREHPDNIKLFDIRKINEYLNEIEKAIEERKANKDLCNNPLVIIADGLNEFYDKRIVERFNKDLDICLDNLEEFNLRVITASLSRFAFDENNKKRMKNIKTN